MKIRVLNTAFYIILFLIAVSSTHLISLPNRVIELLLILFILLYLIEHNFKIVLSREDVKILGLFCVPWLIIMVYSLIIQFSRSMAADYKTHTLFLCLEMILYFLCFYIAYDKLKEKIVDYIFIFFVVAYIPKIIAHFIQFGLIRGITLLYSEENLSSGSALEINKLTYLFGLISVYYLFCLLVKVNNKDKNKRFFILSLIMTILGIKRIVTFSVILTIVMLLLLLRIRRRGLLFSILTAISVGMCVFAMVYVIMIYNGTYEQILNRFGINSMGRTTYWNLFRSTYRISPTFLGNGISFTHRVIHDYGYSIIKFNKNQFISALHNDVLAIYIGLGFFGSILYWIWFFMIKCFAFGIKHPAVGVFSLVVSVQYFIDFTVSNAGLSNDVFAISFILIVVAYFEYKKNIYKIQPENTYEQRLS